MGLSGGGNVIKGFMIVVNIITFLLGGAILGVGIWLKVDKGDYDDISSYDYVTPSNIAIVIGVVMFVVSFLGCCGALMENRILLLIYFVLMIVVIIGEIVVGSIVYVKRDEIEDDLSDDFRKSIKEKYGHPDYSDTTKVIDRFQDDFDCCGYDRYQDWIFSYYVNTTKKIPTSCCQDQYESNPKYCGPATNADGVRPYNTKGCYNEVVEFLEDNMYYIGSVAIAFAVVQIVLVILAMVLYVKVGDLGTYA